MALDALRYKDPEIQRAMEKMRLPNRVLLSDTETNEKRKNTMEDYEQILVKMRKRYKNSKNLR